PLCLGGLLLGARVGAGRLGLLVGRAGAPAASAAAPPLLGSFVRLRGLIRRALGPGRLLSGRRGDGVGREDGRGLGGDFVRGGRLRRGGATARFAAGLGRLLRRLGRCILRGFLLLRASRGALRAGVRLPGLRPAGFGLPSFALGGVLFLSLVLLLSLVLRAAASAPAPALGPLE